MKKLLIALAASSALGTSTLSNAMPIAFDFEFQLNGSTYLTGSFIGEDTNTDNFIRDSELTSLSFTNGINSLVNHTFTPGFSDNFNFDLTSNLFLLGGTSTTNNGQRWNISSTSGFGFAAGNYCAGFYLNNAFQGCDATPATRLVQFVTPTTTQVSEPAPLALLGLALAGIGFTRRMKKA